MELTGLRTSAPNDSEIANFRADLDRQKARLEAYEKLLAALKTGASQLGPEQKDIARVALETLKRSFYNTGRSLSVPEPALFSSTRSPNST